MADFGVADLPCGETDFKTGSIEITMAILIPKAIEIRFFCRGNAVAFGFFAIAESIHDQKHCRFFAHDNNLF